MRRLGMAQVAGLALILTAWCGRPADGQIEDWIVFPDTATDAVCGVVNASNIELIVLVDSGNMVAVSTADVILDDLVVTDDLNVFYLGEPAGIIQYGEDGDNLPTVFWTTLTGTLVGIDSFTGEPFDSELFPDERFHTGCDACDFLDEEPAVCRVVEPDPDDDDDDDDPDFEFPIACGAGTPAMVGFSALLMPLMGVCMRRRGH